MADAGAGLRIAYLTGEYPRGTDTFIQREVAGLRATGATVATFSVRRPDGQSALDDDQKRERDTTTYLVDTPAPRVLAAFLVTAVMSPRRLVRAARLARETSRPGVRGHMFQLAYLAEAIVLARLLRTRRLHHLHNHFGDSSCTVAMLAAELAGITWSFTLHGPRIFLEAHTWRLDEKVRRASFVSCISWFARSQAAVLAPERIDACHVVHCGVDTRVFVGEPATGERLDSTKRLVFVGRLASEKGLLVLVEALGVIAAKHPGVRLSVVGDGPEHDRVRERAVGLGVEVELLGHRPPKEVARLVADADVFVLPSFAEGVPVSLMEAMATGTPVVATAVGGVTELIEHGATGRIVRPGDVEALAAAVVEVLDDPGTAAVMAQRGRAVIERDFDSLIEARRLLSLIRSTIPTRAEPDYVVATRPDPS